MEKPRSVGLGFAVVVKVMGPAGGEGTHTQTHVEKANGKWLRSVVQQGGESDGENEGGDWWDGVRFNQTLCDVICRTAIYSSLKQFSPNFFLISFIQKVETRCSEGLLFWKKHWIHSLKIKYRTVRAFYKLKWKSLDNRRVCVSVCTYVHVCVCVSSVSWAAALEVKWPVKPYIQLEALLKKRKCEVSNKSSLSLLLYQQQISVFSGRAAL